MWGHGRPAGHVHAGGAGTQACGYGDTDMHTDTWGCGDTHKGLYTFDILTNTHARPHSGVITHTHMHPKVAQQAQGHSVGMSPRSMHGPTLEVCSLPHPDSHRGIRPREGKIRKALWTFVCVCMAVHVRVYVRALLHVCAGCLPAPESPWRTPWWTDRCIRRQRQSRGPAGLQRLQVCQETRMCGNKGRVVMHRSCLGPTCFEA